MFYLRKASEAPPFDELFSAPCSLHAGHPRTLQASLSPWTCNSKLSEEQCCHFWFVCVWGLVNVCHIANVVFSLDRKISHHLSYRSHFVCFTALWGLGRQEKNPVLEESFLFHSRGLCLVFFTSLACQAQTPNPQNPRLQRLKPSRLLFYHPPERWTFLSLAFDNAPRQHTVENM